MTSIPLNLHVLSGPKAGQSLAFTAETVSFGRDLSNTVVVDLPHASRKHGELRLADGVWSLHNLSANGTTVNGKSVTRKPLPLHHGDKVGVGDGLIFTIGLSPATGTPATDTPNAPGSPPDSASGRQPMSKRSKLWVGISAYLVLMLVVTIVAMTMCQSPTGPTAATAAQLNSEQIEKIIRAPATVPGPDERLAQENLNAAREHYNRRGSQPRAGYDTVRYYKLALAYMGKSSYAELPEGMDGLHAREAEDDLVNTITQRYQLACNYMLSLQWASAEKAFREIQDKYPDYESPLFKNVQLHLSAVRGHAPARSRGFGR